MRTCLLVVVATACSSGPRRAPFDAEPDAGTWSPREPDLSAMVGIPAGTFAMGHPVERPGAYGQPWKVNELPEHDVTLPELFIDRDEVTVARYAEFLTDAGGRVHWHPLMPITPTGGRFEANAGSSERPIAFVTWYDATTYCAWAGARLPSEAEWERAARGPDGRTFPWGEESPDCGRAVFYLGAGQCADAPREVGARSPAGDSAEGVRDMAGNVAEWVADVYGLYGDGPLVDPRGAQTGPYRVVRGGGLHDSEDALRATARWPAAPADRSAGVGFRCAARL